MFTLNFTIFLCKSDYDQKFLILHFGIFEYRLIYMPDFPEFNWDEFIYINKPSSYTAQWESIRCYSNMKERSNIKIENKTKLKVFIHFLSLPGITFDFLEDYILRLYKSKCIIENGKMLKNLLTLMEILRYKYFEVFKVIGYKIKDTIFKEVWRDFLLKTRISEISPLKFFIINILVERCYLSLENDSLIQKITKLNFLDYENITICTVLDVFSFPFLPWNSKDILYLDEAIYKVTNPQGNLLIEETCIESQDLIILCLSYQKLLYKTNTLKYRPIYKVVVNDTFERTDLHLKILFPLIDMMCKMGFWNKNYGMVEIHGNPVDLRWIFHIRKNKTIQCFGIDDTSAVINFENEKKFKETVKNILLFAKSKKFRKRGDSPKSKILFKTLRIRIKSEYAFKLLLNGDLERIRPYFSVIEQEIID